MIDKTTTPPRLVLLLVAVMILAVCGGDSGDEATSGDSLSIDMVEFSFDPADATVTAGQQIEVTANNIGSIRHEWVILQEGVRLEDEADRPDDEAVFQSEYVFFQIDLEPGSSATETLTTPSTSGIYQIVCTIPGHLSAGMVGELEVVDS